jgi:serine/threonine protein kinase
MENYGTFPESTIQSIAKQLLEAMEEIHTKLDRLHGNINASNVFIDENKRIKVRR